MVVLGGVAFSYGRGTPVHDRKSVAGLLGAPSCGFKNNYFAEMRSGSEEGPYLRLIDLCITQLWRVIKKKKTVVRMILPDAGALTINFQGFLAHKKQPPPI